MALGQDPNTPAGGGPGANGGTPATYTQADLPSNIRRSLYGFENSDAVKADFMRQDMMNSWWNNFAGGIPMNLVAGGTSLNQNYGLGQGGIVGPGQGGYGSDDLPPAISNRLGLTSNASQQNLGLGLQNLSNGLPVNAGQGGQGGPAPGAQDFNNYGMYGWGNFSPQTNTQAGFYNQLGDWQRNQSAPQLQRSSIDWSGYGPPGGGYGSTPMGGSYSAGSYGSGPQLPPSMGGQGYPGQPMSQPPAGPSGPNAASMPSPVTGGFTGAPPPNPQLGSGTGAGDFGGFSGTVNAPPGPATVGPNTTGKTYGGGAPVPTTSGGGMSPMAKGQTANMFSGSDDGSGDYGGAPPPPPPPGTSGMRTATRPMGINSAPPPAAPPPPQPSAGPSPAVKGQTTGIWAGNPDDGGMGGDTSSGINTPKPGAPSSTPPLPGTAGRPPGPGAAEMGAQGSAGPVPGVGGSRGAMGAGPIGPSNVPLTPSGGPAQPSGPPPMGPGGIPAVGQFANPLFQQSQQARQAQLGYMGQLQGDISGRAPSLAQAQLAQATGNAINAQASGAASSGPGNFALASRTAAQNAAGLEASAVNQSAQLRAQEYQNAMNAFGTASNNLRGQDLSSTAQSYTNAMQEAQFGQQQNQEQAELQEKQNALNYMGAQGYYGMGANVQSQDLNSRMHYMDLMAQKYGADRNLAENARQYDTGRSDQWTGAGIETVGTILGLLSDERQKENIAPAKGSEISDFLGKLNPSTFRYKNPAHGAGEHVGIMAQDAGKTKMGRLLVMETPVGLALDAKKTISALLAAGAHHEKRLRSLERRHGARTMGRAA